MIIIATICLFAYIIGSINGAILLFKLLGKKDPRDSHSRNAGTSNVYRQAGLFWAIVVLLFDVGRACGLALISLHYGEPAFTPWVCFFLILGNRFPVFHSFKGGKGVANYLGFTAVIAPLFAGISAVAWVAVFAIVRVPFIASFFMVGCLTAGIIIMTSGNIFAVTGSVLTGTLILLNHKKNIVEYITKRGGTTILKKE